MDWVTNWDPIVHGTVVFGATVPFFLGLLAASFLPRRGGWVVALAVAPTVFWLFGWPALPPATSDDAAVTGWLAATIGLFVGHAGWSTAYRLAVWSTIAWLLYPAWLSAGEGVGRHLAVAGAMAVTIAAFAVGAGRLVAERPADLLTVFAFVPAGGALAVLLQLGGATQFSQSAAALAAALAGAGVLFVKREETGAAPVEFWAVITVFLAWCGWLFAEVRFGLAVVLLAAPLAAWGARRLPLPRRHPWQAALWDFVASGTVAGPVAAVAIFQYLADAGESEGY